MVGTENVRKASPLSLAKIEQQDSRGVYHEIVLYYQTSNGRLGRIKGILRGGEINWLLPATVEDADHLEPTTMISVVTSDKVNYVYYIPKGDNKYKAYVDPADSSKPE